MASDDQIALTIIKGTLIALPLFLGALRFVLQGIEIERENEDASRWAGLVSVFNMAALSTVGFLCLILACFVSMMVLTGNESVEIVQAMNLVLAFFVVLGFQFPFFDPHSRSALLLPDLSSPLFPHERDGVRGSWYRGFRVTLNGSST